MLLFKESSYPGILAIKMPCWQGCLPSMAMLLLASMRICKMISVLLKR